MTTDDIAGGSSNGFAFGKNWQAFLNRVDGRHVEASRRGLQRLLRRDSLDGVAMLDLGCGSGLSSAAAHALGADVTSVDVDADCIACTETLRRRFASETRRWRIRRGSVLDPDFMASLGQFDLVYSWGVLHHTGDLATALRHAVDAVSSPGGELAIAIYNDQGGSSRRWRAIKRGYGKLPTWFRPIYVAAIAGVFEVRFAAARLLQLRNPLPLADWRSKLNDRGMSAWHDWVDWIGGDPFEVATPEAIIMPMIDRGLELKNLRTVGSGWGCNEFLFRRVTR